MQSKTSFFNKALFLKNLIRFWPLWLFTTLILCITPISTFMSRRDLYHYSFINILPQTVMIDAVSTFVPVYAMIYACLCAMCVWNYLFNRKSAYSIHALPCTRTELFITNYISGIVLMLIPSVIAGGLEIAAVASAYGFSAYGVFMFIGMGLVILIFFFSFATLIAMVVGHIVALPALYLLFNFVALAIEGEFYYLLRGYCPGVKEVYEDSLEFLAPIVFLYNKTNINYIGGNRIETYAEPLKTAIILLIVSVLFVAVSMIIYSKKSLERAGQAISVKLLNPILMGLVTLIGTVGGAAIGTELFVNGNNDKLYEIPIQVIIFMVISAAICYFLSKVIVESTIRVFNKKSFSIFGGIVVAIVVVNLLFYCDILGLTKKTPKLSDIESVNLTVNYGKECLLTDEEAIETVLEVHKAMVMEAKERNHSHRASMMIYSAVYEDNSHWEYSDDEPYMSMGLGITYNLKDGSSFSRIYRDYEIDYRKIAEVGSIEQKIDVLYHNHELLEQLIFKNDKDAVVRDIYLDSMYDIDVYRTIPDNLYAKVVDAIEKDLWNDKLIPTEWYCKDDTGLFINVEFMSKSEEYGYKGYVSFFVTKDCRNILDVLVNEGICTEDFLNEYLHGGNGIYRMMK